MRLLDSGVTWRTESTTSAHDLALARHPWVRSIRIYPGARGPVEASDKGLPPIPHEEAGPVDGGIGKAPEWVGVIRQEIGSNQRIFAGSDSLATKGTVSPSSFDPIHDLSWRKRQPLSNGPRISCGDLLG
jgi:hypothetical protein